MEGIQTTIKFTGPGDSIGVIKVGGYIDTTTSSELERALGSLLKKGQYRIIVDLGDVDYISSAGWGIFISEIKGIKENAGDLKLVRMIPEVYEVFELLEFHYILKAYDTIEEAVDAFVKEAGGTLTGPGGGQTTEVRKPAAVRETPKMEEKVEVAEPTVSMDDMTIDEKIRAILRRNPAASARDIKRLLNTEEFGFTKVGWFEARRRMKTSKRV
jgi:anti-sigma B factor antagonist